MATPRRLVKLSCPPWGATHWVIDNDYRGAMFFGQRELDYDERTYACPHCGQHGSGFRVRRKTPVSLTLNAPRVLEFLARLLRAR